MAGASRSEELSAGSARGHEATSTGWYGWHLAALLAVLLLVQAPRLGGTLARWLAPVFPPGREYVDLEAYYRAGVAIQEDPSRLYREAEYDPETGTLRITARSNFVNLPLVAWLFVPLTFLREQQAGTALLLLNILSSLGSLLLLQRRLHRVSSAARWGVTLAFVSSGPLITALNLGQTSPLVLLMLLSGEACLRRRQDGRAGLLLAMVCLIKVPPLLFFPYFVLRRRWRLVATSAMALTAATIISLTLYGPTLHCEYFNVAFRGNWGKVIAAHNCQSIPASVARALTGADLMSWQPFEPSLATAWVSGAALLGILLAAGSVLRSRALSYERMLLELGMVLCVSLVATPIFWVHYATWLLPVAVVIGGALREQCGSDSRRCWATPLLGLAVLLINIPIPPSWIIRRFADEPWFRLAISHTLVGTLLLLGLSIWLARVRQGPPRRVEEIA